MRFKKTQSLNANQQGFTLIEMVLVIGIIAILGSIAVGEYYHRRQVAYDRQAIAVTKNLLTMAATAFANSDNPAEENTSVGTYPPGYPELQVNNNIHIEIDKDDSSGNGDVWNFYIASEAGSTAYFFWLPGDNCTETEVNGTGSDLIAENAAWRGGVFGI